MWALGKHPGASNAAARLPRVTCPALLATHKPPPPAASCCSISLLAPQCPPPLQALADELKQRPMELVRLYRELGCTEIAVNSTNPEDGTRTKSFRVRLLCGVRSGCMWMAAAQLGCVSPARCWLSCHCSTLATAAPRAQFLCSHHQPHCPPLLLQISLMPGSVEEKTLADYFPALKLGARKR